MRSESQVSRHQRSLTEHISLSHYRRQSVWCTSGLMVPYNENFLEPLSLSPRLSLPSSFLSAVFFLSLIFSAVCPLCSLASNVILLEVFWGGMTVTQVKALLKSLLSHALRYMQKCNSLWPQKPSSFYWKSHKMYSVLFVYKEPKNVRPSWTFEGIKRDKTGQSNRLLYLRIVAPWDYLWSVKNDITNPKKQLYNYNYFLALGLLHNKVHIWFGRD